MQSSRFKKILTLLAIQRNWAKSSDWGPLWKVLIDVCMYRFTQYLTGLCPPPKAAAQEWWEIGRTKDGIRKEDRKDTREEMNEEKKERRRKECCIVECERTLTKHVCVCLCICVCVSPVLVCHGWYNIVYTFAQGLMGCCTKQGQFTKNKNKLLNHHDFINVPFRYSFFLLIILTFLDFPSYILS